MTSPHMTPIREAVVEADDRLTFEAELFLFLCRRYVQRADMRQREMGLQYMDVETHDLAKQVAKFALDKLAAAPHPPAPDAAAEAAVLAERDACVSAALSARFGPPSMWGSGNPRGWHLDQECLPWDASMHDNGCVDAAKVIRARTAAPQPRSGE